MAQCNQMTGITDIVLNGYLFLNDEVRDILPKFQGKDANGDCVIDANDYPKGGNLALARDIVKAKGWPQISPWSFFTPVKLYTWAKQMEEFRSLTEMMRALINIPDLPVEGMKTFDVDGNTPYYDKVVWYTRVIPLLYGQCTLDQLSDCRDVLIDKCSEAMNYESPSMLPSELYPTTMRLYNNFAGIAFGKSFRAGSELTGISHEMFYCY